jgi:large subunit ribosomal protein L5e
MRKRLIIQDKNKYNTPKYRLVVRLSNTDVVCQIIYATLKSDRVLAAAYASELPKFGATITSGIGQKNYAAAYATGLLLARRVLTKLKLDKSYVGVAKADGAAYQVAQGKDETRRPFKVFLDIGLARTTTGGRIFGAMKGAIDGGLYVPHNHKRLPGGNKLTGPKKEFNPKLLRKYIYGGHISEYMKLLQAKNPEKYQKQFARYVKAGKGPDDIEKMWTAVHASIRKDPSHKKVERKQAPKKVKHLKEKKNLKQRKDRVKQKIASAKKAKNV